MRVGLVIYGSLGTLTGGYLYDHTLATYLREHGDAVEVVSLPNGRYPHHLLHNISSRFFQRLLNLQVDVLLQDELNHPSLFLLNQRLQGRVAYPVVSIVHHARCCEPHPMWQNAIYRRIERSYLLSVDGFIFNSETTRSKIEQLSATAPVRARRSIVAHPGRDRLDVTIDDAQIKERSYDKMLRLLFIGSIIPRKGLHTLIHALTQIPDEPWTLTVVGNGGAQPSYTRAIIRQLEHNKLGGRISFRGAASDAQLSHHLRASHLLVVPSAYEGYGIVYAEGMGFGLPAIGAMDGGAREVIAHKHNGFLVPPNDAVSLRRYVVELMYDRERLCTMSLNARRSYESLPTWQESMHKIQRFLNALTCD